MAHPRCILARGRIFWTVKFLQTIQHQCSETKESTARNSWQEKFSPSPHKWQQDSAQLGPAPWTGDGRRLMGHPRNTWALSHSHCLQAVGQSLSLPGRLNLPLGYKKEAFSPFPETLKLNVFLPCQPWMASLPSQPTGQAVPPGALCVLFQAGSSAWGALLKQCGTAGFLIWSCCPVFPADRTHLAQWWAYKVSAGQQGK